MIIHHVFILRRCIRVLHPGPHPLFKIAMFSSKCDVIGSEKNKTNKNKTKRTFKTLASDKDIVILPTYAKQLLPLFVDDLLIVHLDTRI